MPSFDDVQPGEAAASIAAALARGDEWLPTEEAERLLACYGIPLAPHGQRPDAGGGVGAARVVRRHRSS